MNAQKNQLLGSTYDNNGNVLTLNNATLAYDVENRLTSYTASGGFVENYAYDEGNRRVEKWNNSGKGVSDNVYFYGPDGKLLSVLNVSITANSPWFALSTAVNRIYFGGMVLGSSSGYATADTNLMKDRLGSARPAYPYGTDISSGVAEGDDFATYWQDYHTGFEYAMNRYYSAGYGRFLTVDPFGGSAKRRDPGTWNRYAYTSGDPIGNTDSFGLDEDIMIDDIPFESNVTEMEVTDVGDDLPFYQVGADIGQGLSFAGPSGAGTGGGGGWNSVSWASLSDNCKQGLLNGEPNSIGNRVNALLELSRAYNAESTLQTAAKNSDIPWTLLAAIGIQESGFTDKNERDGSGVGVGVFQITNPSEGITEAGANNLATAAAWAVQTLLHNENYIDNNFDTTASMAEWMLVSSWNTGLSGQITRWNDGESPDWHTSPNHSTHPTTYGNNYGQNVLGIMDCFK